MRYVNRFPVLIFGVTATLVLGWLTADVSAQRGDEEGIHVCVAADGVLRLAESTAICPPGEKSLYLAKPGAEEIETPEEEPDSKDSESIDEHKLADLERRIKAMEHQADGRSIGNRVVAPFEVVDKAGQRIFYVEEEHVRVYNGAGKEVALIRTTDRGGYFVGSSASGGSLATIGAGAPNVGVKVLENNVERIYLGRKGEGNYVALFYASGGNRVAGIGQSKAGTGAAYVADESGLVKAVIMLDSERKGLISVKNGSDNHVATLTEGKNGAGLLTIGSSSGERMVAAGVQPEGFGVVQAGPASFSTAAGLGLPGSYIMGKP